jgi:hypothetical protein
MQMNPKSPLPPPPGLMRYPDYLLLLGLKFFDPPCCVVPFPLPYALVVIPFCRFHSSLPERRRPDVEGFFSSIYISL